MTTNQLITRIGRQRVITALANVVCQGGGSSSVGFVDITGSPSDNAALAAALALKAALASPTFTGTPAAPTAAVGTNTTQLATTAFVHAALSSYASWTPVFTGFGTDPTGLDCRYLIRGKQMHITVFMNTGVSNATTFTMTLPSGVNARTGAFQVAPCQVTNNSMLAAALGLMATRSGSNIIDLYRDGTGAAWTASNNKFVRLNCVIEID